MLKIQQTYCTLSWNGTIEQRFVTGFVKLLTEYNTMVPVAQHILEADRILYLHQSVAGETLLGVQYVCTSAKLLHILNGNTPSTLIKLLLALYQMVCANLDRTVRHPRNNTTSANNQKSLIPTMRMKLRNTSSYRANNHNFVDDDKDLEDNTAREPSCRIFCFWHQFSS
jgi:hypothetical protein